MSKFFEALKRAERDSGHPREGNNGSNGSNGIESHGATTRSNGQSGPVPLERLDSEPVTRAFSIDHSTKLDPHLVSFLTPTTFEAEQYRTLRYMVDQRRQERKLSIIAVSSPAAQDGKSTTLANLAGALTQDKKAKVLLVDLDLRRPSLLKMMGLRNSGNLGAVDFVVRPDVSLEDVVLCCPSLRIDVVPAGRPPTALYEILKSARLGALLEEARRRYDYVLLDTSPLVPFPDCRLIGQWADGFIVVVASHKTPRPLLEEALTTIEPGKLIGMVFNKDNRPALKYQYRYSNSLPTNGNGQGWLGRAFGARRRRKAPNGARG